MTVEILPRKKILVCTNVIISPTLPYQMFAFPLYPHHTLETYTFYSSIFKTNSFVWTKRTKNRPTMDDYVCLPAQTTWSTQIRTPFLFARESGQDCGMGGGGRIMHIITTSHEKILQRTFFALLCFKKKELLLWLLRTEPLLVWQSWVVFVWHAVLSLEFRLRANWVY